MMTSTSREEFLKSPAASPPPGVTPNFENPENIGSYALPLLIIVVSVAHLVFLAKLWVVVRMVKKLLVEDWLLILAWLVYGSAFCTFAVLITKLPVGMHQWDMNMEKYMRHLYLYNCAWIVYGFLMILIKANILLQYIRIFVPDGIRSFTSIASYSLIVLNTVYYTLYIFLLLLACVPRSKIWDATVKGRCIDWRIVLATGNSVTLISDVIIWLVPQRVIWRLRLDRGRKWGMSALFTIGVFAIVCSGVRIHFSIKLFTNSSDIAWVGSRICFWGTCQVTAGFLVACLPTMPRLMNHIGKQAWAERLGNSMRTLLRRSGGSYSGGSNSKAGGVVTIGGGGGAGRIPNKGGKRNVTDVEFDELVNRTDVSIPSRVESFEESRNLPKGSDHNV